MTSTLLLTIALWGAPPEAWPGFLGSGATPLAAERMPLKWSAAEGVAWRAKLPGHGQSSPVVLGETVYVTAIDGATKETLLLVALGLADGKIQWKATRKSTAPEKNSLYISRAAPTPLVDGERVYAYFESGDVMAVSHRGESLWHRSLSTEYGPPKNKFGLSASPIQTESLVIVLIDDEGPSYLVALNKKDGSVAWKQDRDSRASWSSPALVTIGGMPQIVCSSAGSIDGYDPGSGRKLWSYTDVGGNSGTTPLSPADGQFFVGASAGREGQNAAGAKRSNGLARVTKSSDGWGVEMLWRTEEASPSWASPMAHAGCAYWINRAGVVFCFDVATGKKHYSERVKQGAWATPIGVGDRLYIFGKEGLTTVLATGPDFSVLAENSLWGPDDPPHNNAPPGEEDSEERRRAAAMFAAPTVYGVAAVNHWFVVRTGSMLYGIEKR